MPNERDIRLRALPINWQGLSTLAKAVNNLRDDPLGSNDVWDMKPPRETFFAVPMIASVIANKRNPDVSVIYPTAEQIIAAKPWLKGISKGIGRFSPKWQTQFERFLENKGANAIEEAANRASRFMQKVEAISDPNPKKTFITDFSKIYQDLAKPETEIQQGFLWDDEVQIPVERKIEEMLEDMFFVAQGGKGRHRFSIAKYPFISRLIRLANFPSESFDRQTAAIAGAELASGMRTFLVNEGYQDLLPAPAPAEFDLFNPQTYWRGLAEWFQGSKLEQVKRELPIILKLAKEAIPDNPAEVVQRVYQIAEDVVWLKRQGKTDGEIVEALFAK